MACEKAACFCAEITVGEVPSPAALAWFIAEDRALQASLAAAFDGQDWDIALRLARGLRTSLWYRGRYAELVHVAQTGLAAAEHGGIESSAIGLMIHLAQARRALGEPEGVAELYTRAERFALEGGDEGVAAWIRVHCGDFALDQGRPEDALAAYRSAQQVYDAQGDIAARIWLAGHDIDALRALDRYDDAIRVGEDVLRMSVDRGNPGEIAWCRGHLGLLYHQVGRYPEAEDLLTLAMQVPQAEGDPVGQAHRLRQLAWVATDAGDPDKARRHLTQALAFAERLDIGPLVADLTADLRRLNDLDPR